MDIRETKKEAPAFVLGYSDYNVSADREVSWSELKGSKQGDRFEVTCNKGCGRAIDEVTAEVAYRTNEGCAVLFRRAGTTDDPDPKSWERKPYLMWFEFR